jgi:replicative DNA helicase
VSITGEVQGAGQRGEPPSPERGSGGFGAPAGDRPADSGFDRTPPQDVAAEQCVLGGMLLSKDAIADVVEILRGTDFYRPAHAVVFDAILDIYGRGDPADPITVAAALADAGALARVGGAPYLHTLIASVPTAANAAYYARIVAERAVLRRLVEAGTRIVQLGYGTAAGYGRDVDEVVDLAQQAVYDVTERRVSEDFAILADLLQPTLDEIDAIGSRGEAMTGVPTGFGDLDRLLNGLHPGQLVVVAGRPGLGKALALDTPLPTPTGWTTMGAVRVGDWLIGADGRPARVSAVSEVQLDRDCAAVRFCDGSRIVADGSHRWQVETEAAQSAGPVGARPFPPARVVTTDEIRVEQRRGSRRHRVRTTAPLLLPDRPLPIAPYVLGAWLGSGTGVASFTSDEPELALFLEAAGVVAEPVAPGRFRVTLPGAVPAQPRIPLEYLRASAAQRRALLAGLLDFAGSVTGAGAVQYWSAQRGLTGEVRDLVTGLGYRCTVTGTGSHGEGWWVRFSAPDDVFWHPGKQVAHKQARGGPAAANGRHRVIVAIEPVPSVPVRCVSVDNPDHLYLAGRAMIPTHNSTVSMDFARSASVRHNLASAIFSLEMSKVEIVMRLLSAEARVPLHVLRSGQLSDDDWTRLARRMGEISNAPLFVDDTPNMTLMEIRAKARRLRQRHDLKLVIVDYLQLMTSPKRVESRQQEVADLSRGLKLLAKEIECPVIAVSQLNRGPEQRTDKRPQLSDLRESGCLTADTTLLRADTGSAVTFAELLRDGFDGVLVWSLDEHRRLVPAPVTAVFPSGVKEVYRLRLASGRQVKASANHRFLTAAGWRRLGELMLGDKLAVPGRIPDPVSVARSGGGVRLAGAGAAPDTAGDVSWDRVAALTPLGPRPVYDATVKGTHNFVADGILAHNSIEQDADVVILLHRDDYYDRESPRAGEADFIVAKHRNGPTDTITVAAQLHLSRFVDMAI